MHVLISATHIEVPRKCVCLSIFSFIYTSLSLSVCLSVCLSVSPFREDPFTFEDIFAVFKTFEDAMEALESKKVSGILVDRYTGYYHLTHKSRYTNMSLLTSDHIPFKASLGLVIPKEREYLVGCLSVLKNEIRKSAQAITSTYKVRTHYIFVVNVPWISLIELHD